jgi:hypothetical protein
MTGAQQPEGSKQKHRKSDEEYDEYDSDPEKATSSKSTEGKMAITRYYTTLLITANTR